MRTPKRVRQGVNHLLPAVVAAAVGLLGSGNSAPAAILFFGDNATAPHGDFQVTSGALGGPNYYNDATDTGGATPAAADTLHLGNNATITNGTGENVTVTEIRVGVAPGNTPTGTGVTYTNRTGTLNMTGGAVNTTATGGGGSFSTSIGDGRTGQVNLSGTAAYTVAGRTLVGVAGPAGLGTGTLTVNDTAIFNANGGAGMLVGGQVMSGQVTLNGTGQILIPNGWLFMGGGTETASSTGNTFVQNGGTVNVEVEGAFSESIIIGHAVPSSASYTLNGGVLTAVGTAQIGNFGTGTFTATGGTANLAEVNIANFSGSAGLFRVVGGGADINVADRFTISVGDDSLVSATGGFGTLRFETDAAANLSIIDVTSPSGAAVFGDATTVELDHSLAGTPSLVYDLLTASDITADLGAITFNGPVGYQLQINPGLRGEVLQAVVPEPASLSLLAAAGLLGLRRRPTR